MLKTHQPYRDNVERIAQDLTGCGPEVCLAVRVPHLLSRDEDDSEIDTFLSSHGFEYVDATKEQIPPRSDDLHEEEDFAGLIGFLDGEYGYLFGFPRHPPDLPSTRCSQYYNVAFHGDENKDGWQNKRSRISRLGAKLPG